jgi:hypothetical protein
VPHGSQGRGRPVSAERLVAELADAIANRRDHGWLRVAVDGDGGWLDGSSGAVVAAFLVAAARSPSNCPEQRQQLIETVSSVLDIQKYDVGILSV